MRARDQRRRLTIRFVFHLAIAIVLLGTVTPAEKPGSDKDKMDEFARCLTKKNAIMYGSFVCSHCDDQRKLFGDSFKYVHYVECSRIASPQDSHACQATQVRYTPTWVLDGGERLVGIQSLKTLSEKTGCPLP